MAAAAVSIPVPRTENQCVGTPTGFVRNILRKSIWRAQSDILESVLWNRRTAVKSCHASGKTFIAAAITLYWVSKYDDGIVVTTAPTNTQVKNILWREVREQAAGSRMKFPSVLTQELKLGEKNYALGLSTNQAPRFQGFHSRHILVILDEAPGVRGEVWDAVQGLMAGGDVRLLAIGNPTITGGPFYDAFTTQRERWATYTINAFDTPNLQHCSHTFRRTATDEHGKEYDVNTVIGYGPDIMEMEEDALDHAVRPYLCTRRWVREMIEDNGINNPLVEAKVFGDFPTEGADVLIPLSWLERARLVEDGPEVAKLPICAGLDVAGAGQADTVLVVRRGPRVLLVQGWTSADPRGEVVAALAPFKSELIRLNVDSIGIGWNMYTHLRDQFGRASNGAERVFPVNVGLEPRNREKFFNAKAEYYWALRERAKVGDLRFPIPDKTVRGEDRVLGQLSVIRYAQNARGQIVIESKEDLRKRGIKSPDAAEATMLAFVERVRGESAPIFAISSITQPSGWRMG